MRVLVIGSGGREHALVWKIKQSPKVKEIFCAPGNAGTEGLGRNIQIPAEDVDSLREFAIKEKIGLTVVGPEGPLVSGIVDKFESAGLFIFGPKAEASIIEGSKVFAKNLMKKYGIGTADFVIFKDPDSAIEYIKKKGPPLVVKADGLAGGKGVIVCKEEDEAIEAVDRIMNKKEFGEAGREVIVEECLFGEEASILAFTDGKTIIPMASAQDHKPVFDNDEGPNTGGMGAYSPAPIVTDEILGKVTEDILKPTIAAMTAEGRPYKGVLYVGLMITEALPKVLEFNVRFGDPETQAILPRMKSDLLPILEAVIEGKLDEIKIEWDNRACVCVVLASGGYPGSYKKGYSIDGLKETKRLKDVIIFHAGTAIKDGKVVTSGGRVLNVSALAPTIKGAIDKTYKAVKLVKFQDMHYRGDIGKKALF